MQDEYIRVEEHQELVREIEKQAEAKLALYEKRMEAYKREAETLREINLALLRRAT